jgi:hypothetical protein
MCPTRDKRFTNLILFKQVKPVFLKNIYEAPSCIKYSLLLCHSHMQSTYYQEVKRPGGETPPHYAKIKDNWNCTQPLFPIYFTLLFFKVPCLFTPLLNLRSLIFNLTPFGWPPSIKLTTYS